MVARLVAVLLIAITSGGCDLGKEGQPPGGGTLTLRLKADVPLINPLVDEFAARRVLGLIFSGLTKLDATLRVQPDLAESWETSPNGLVWTFRLRDNLRWHDGMALTVEDVVYTYRYLMQGEPASIVQADLQNVVEDVAVVDQKRVRLTLRRAFAPLLVDTAVPIVPKHIWTGLADPRKVPVTVGSGPFRLAEHRPGQAIILEANPSYHGGRPYLDRLAIVFGGDEAALQAVGSGQLLLAEIDFESLPKVPLTYNLHAYAEIGYNYVGFNLREGRLFADRNLRLAWAAALDKEKVVAEATDGRSQTIWGPIPTAIWAYDSSRLGRAPTVRDVVEAKRLLAESGWRDRDGDGIADKDGRPLSFELLVRGDAKDRVAAARLMAEQLREAGFDARVTPADFATVMAAKRKPPFDFTAMIMGWDLSPDPDSYYLFASGQIPAEGKTELLNYVGFKNGEYDRLAIEARTTLDYERRRELYAKIQALLVEELPYYFLWAERTYLTASPRIRGPINLNSPLFLWNMDKWYLGE